MEVEEAHHYSCAMCQFKSLSRITVVQHMVRHHRFDEKFVANCNFPNCQATYHNWASFKKHIVRKHRNEQPEPIQEVENVDILHEEIAEQHLDVLDVGPEAMQQAPPMNDICGQYVKYIQYIREGCNISQKATDRVTDGILQFSEDMMGDLKGYLLLSADHQGNISTASVEEAFDRFKLRSAIESVKSKYLLDKYLVQSGYLILPEAVCLGKVWCWMKNPRLHLARVPVNFYEVPFFPILQQLLNQDDVLHCVDNPRPPEVSGMLRDYPDGSYVKAHPIFGNDPKSLKIILYYDDVEIANPLGSKVKTHKLAMFYWTLANIHPEFRSSLSIVNLLCVVKSIHLRKYGMNKILENFVRDIKTLESPEGKIFLINGVERQFRGSLLIFTGDTLAANYVGGFKEGVAFAKKPCRACLGSQITTKLFFKESEFVLRDKMSHAEQCESLSEPGLTKDDFVFWSKEYGINGRSILCDIETFDITKCLVQDLMHVVIEGVLELEMRHFLKYCVDGKFIKLNQLNTNITNFDYGHLIKDKPSLIEPQHLDHKLRQNCAQLITLGNALPFLLNDRLEDDNERLLNLILLLQILNGLLSYEITVDEVTLMKRMIEIHHKNFVSLYRTPTPKFHFMVHLPGQILLFGPCRHQWCMRFEGAHCRFKHMATVVKNFKNISLTLSYRHQSLRCAGLFKLPHEPQMKILYRGDKVTPGSTIKLGDYEHCDHVMNCLNINNLEKQVVRTKSITVKGTFYKIGGIVLLRDDDDDLPQFGTITSIAVIDNTKVLIFKKLDTLLYAHTKNAYQVCVVVPNVFGAVGLTSLIHPHPMSLFRVGSDFYVILLNYRRNEFF